MSKREKKWKIEPRLTATQRLLLELPTRCGAATRETIHAYVNKARAAAGKDPLSEDAIRVALIRLADRWLCKNLVAAENVAYVVPTPAGCRKVGAEPRGKASTFVALLQLAVSDFCFQNGKVLLTAEELREELARRDKALLVPRIPRGRFYVEEGKLGYVDVDLESRTAFQVIRRLRRYGERLMDLGPAWEPLVREGKELRYVVLTHYPRDLELQRERKAQGCPTPLRSVVSPLLERFRCEEPEVATSAT